MSFERVGGEEIWKGHIGTVRVEQFRHDDGEVVAARGGRAPRRGRDAAARRRPDLARAPAARGGGRAEPARAARRQAERRRGRSTTAKRELREEIGKSAASWRYLTSFYASPGFTDEEIHAYLATDLSDDPLEAEENERIEIVSEPLDRLDDVIRSCRDSKSLVTLLWFRAFVLWTVPHVGQSFPRGRGAGRSSSRAHRRRAHPGVVPRRARDRGRSGPLDRSAPPTRCASTAASEPCEVVGVEPPRMHARTLGLAPLGSAGKATMRFFEERRDARGSISTRRTDCRSGRWGACWSGSRPSAAGPESRHAARDRLLHGVRRARLTGNAVRQGGRAAREKPVRMTTATRRHRSGSWCSTSSPTWSSSGAWRATRSSPTAPTCSSSAPSWRSAGSTAEDAGAARRLRLPDRAGAGRRRRAGCDRHDPAQGGGAALLLPPPAPRGRARVRSDGEAHRRRARASKLPQRAGPRGGAAAARAAEGHRARSRCATARCSS